ncbi:MAG TPA: metallophosphoesterase [Clostridiales bacterium]|nr:MAG: hypothetical protein A2Y18_06495 [Clostridiales bacterium GWD2_32_19]HCC07056.1 metallophosphoesterase [Clostridiales bacterium]
MRNKKLIFRIISLIIGACLLIVIYDTNTIKLNEVSFKSAKLETGDLFTIMQISDFHNKHSPNSFLTSLKFIKEHKPDIIVITGDLIDSNNDDFNNIYSFIDQIVAINPNVYCVSGNHEWRLLDLNNFIKGLVHRNVKVINNTNLVIKHNDVKINLCGVDDHYTRHDDLELASQNMNSEDYTVLLSHSLRIVDSISKPIFDLILSGHTHGGQVRLPFLGALIAPGEGFFPKYDKGIYEISENKFLYLDSGIGTSVLPIRFLNQSQMSLIKIEGIK